jgi:hypothetical protein
VYGECDVRIASAHYELMIPFGASWVSMSSSSTLVSARQKRSNSDTLRDPRPRCSRRRLQEEPTKRLENRAACQIHRFVGSDEDGGSPGEHRSERRSHRTQRALASEAINSDRATRRAEEEGGDTLFVPERRRSRRAPRRDSREASASE